MMRCSAMSWTDEEAGRLRMLVTRRDLVTGATTVTEEQTVQCAHFTGTVAEKGFMERRWCERLRQAMLRVDKRKRNASIRAVDRAARPVQEGREADGGAARQDAQLDRSYIL